MATARVSDSFRRIFRLEKRNTVLVASLALGSVLIALQGCAVDDALGRDGAGTFGSVDTAPTPDEAVVTRAPVQSVPTTADVTTGPSATPAPSLPDVGSATISGTPEVDLRIREGALAGDLLGSHLAQIGDAKILVSIATLEGGRIHLAEGRVDGLSLRMPEYMPQGTYPRAVVGITSDPASSDVLAPGGADFRFGIDFWVDPVSANREIDNGDNLIQRGLASDPSQFKLEIDRGKANCRIAGASGEVEVKAKDRVVPERWYRAECARQGEDVILTVTAYDQENAPSQSVTSERGPTGNISWARPEIPLALGGKLAANGAVIRSATDQFNGRLANPDLSIDRPQP